MDIYEKKYKEALERARTIVENQNASSVWKDWLCNTFPELKESENERIRKELIVWLKNSEGQTLPIDRYNAALAWLEKQGESYTKKDVDNAYIEGMDFAKHELEKQGEQKSADSYCQENCKGFQETGKCFADGMCKAKREAESVEKAEPKFKIGNWIVDKYGLTQQVLDFRGGIYTCTYNSFTTDCESNYHLWNIKDAKHGDVLHSIGFHSDCIFIFDGLDNWKFDEPDGERAVATGYCCLTLSADNMEFGIQGPDCIEVDTVKPATKIQRDLLFKKMHEAGYEWDAEHKQLNKIEQKSATMSLDEAIEHCREKSCGNNACALEHKQLEKWLIELKELKERKPAEWSEEDEVKINRIVACLENLNVADNDILLKDVDWLKSLRPQNRWKPSDEQMEVLKEATSIVGSKYKSCLNSLYSDLKKLKD